MKLKEKESDIQKAILQWLGYKKIYAWRNNTGAMSGEYKGKKWFVRFGMPGVSDILGCLPDGRFLAIEVKSKGGKVSEVQQQFIDTINKMGGVAFMTRSLFEVESVFEYLEKEWKKKHNVVKDL